ncbi:hypothetical protein ACFRLW_22375 [Streptomyces sp. NPDC056728]
MSEYGGQDPDTYVPLLYRDLEDLEESEHIDALYDILERTRQRAALLVLALPGVAEGVRLHTRAAALLLDLDQAELEHELGGRGMKPVRDILDFAIRAYGDDGYVGEAMEALFRQELAAPPTD